jgi:hypothetical protein
MQKVNLRFSLRYNKKLALLSDWGEGERGKNSTHFKSFSKPNRQKLPNSSAASVIAFRFSIGVPGATLCPSIII